LNLVYQQPLEQEKENIDNESIPKEGKYKILIVEDNDSLREMLVNIFKSLYTVITAVNGKEGLEKTCSEMPHIVISDIIMPEMSGTELCLAIKQNFDTCHIPVVLLTAKTTIEHNLEGLKMGADDYIAKPYSVKEVLARIKAVLKRSSNKRVEGMLPNERFLKHEDLCLNLTSKKVFLGFKTLILFKLD
jgi:DNA-binding response OmpR family regulator